MAQKTSGLWKQLFRQRGTICEYKFDINGREYGPESEVSHSVSQSPVSYTHLTLPTILRV